jgi:hypothetical protein
MISPVKRLTGSALAVWFSFALTGCAREPVTAPISGRR